MNEQAELARLETVIAENDALDTPLARWRAADAVEKKAAIVERSAGPDAALALYEDVARRLEGSQDPGPRTLLIYALNVLAHLHEELGNPAEARAVAERLVAEHFDDAPEEAIEVVADGAMLLGKLRAEAGDLERAVETYDRVIERYGRALRPSTVALAHKNAGFALGSAGRLDDSIDRYARVIELLADAEDPRARQRLADAMARQAYYMYESRRPDDGATRCRELIDRFGAEADPKIADSVAWAREMLAFAAR